MEKRIAKAHLALLVANLLFGLNNPVTRSLVPNYLNPYFLAFCRFSGGAMLFWLASFFMKKERIAWRDVFRLFFAAFFAMTANQIPFIVGLSKTSPVDASIVVSMLPVVSMIIASVVLKESVTRLKVIGVLLGVFGALLLILSSRSGGVGSGSVSGNLIVFLAVVSFGFYLSLFKDLISRYSAVGVMKWMFLFATLQSFPFTVQPLMNTDFSMFGIGVWVRIFYVVVVATFLTYFLLGFGQKYLRPTTLSMYNYIQPIVASMVGVYLGMDVFGYEKLVAALLVFVGVYLVAQNNAKLTFRWFRKMPS